MPRDEPPVGSSTSGWRRGTIREVFTRTPASDAQLLHWRARDTSLDRDVAARILPGESFAEQLARDALYTRMSNHERAWVLLGETLDIRIRVLGQDNRHVGHPHCDLGSLAASMARREETLDHLRKAVELKWAERDILGDTTLDSLRGDAEFEAILTEIRKRLGEA